ncbi:MAG TPA: RnfH family protein [Burkholderiales bacterium]|nr:RnfH family protein [Burkholderiales bacterium]
MQSDEIMIRVVYAAPLNQTVVELRVAKGATAGQAITQSGILQKHPEIDLAKNGIGIFGQHVDAGAPLRDGDRVEIYRPLIADPKEARRRRAQANKRVRK